MTSVGSDNSGPTEPDYENKGVTLLKNVVIRAISFVNRGANGKRFFLFKSEDGTGTPEDDTSLGYTELIKNYNPFTNTWDVAYCVIAEPGELDSQKDVWSVEEIEKACNRFIEDSDGLLNFMHEDLRRVGTLAQNAIALVDMELDTPEGKHTIKKGSWYIAVRPNKEVRRLMDEGKITGMSVQGSAERVPVNKAEKEDQPLEIGTEGPGITKLQNILGIEETGVYDVKTHELFVLWMKDKGVPGTPTLATLKSILSSDAGASVEKEKEYVPTDPSDTDRSANMEGSAAIGAAPGNVGVDRDKINVHSPVNDLKALLGEAMGEDNEALKMYLVQMHQVASAEALYAAELSHADLWFMVSKFILGVPADHVDETGELSEEEPVVEKESGEPAFEAGDVVLHGGNGAVIEEIDGEHAILLTIGKTGREARNKVLLSELSPLGSPKKIEKAGESVGGSMGGHDPRKYGKIKYIVRAFPKWAGGLHRVCVARLRAEHPEVANGREDALCAWLKDQWSGTTKWRGKRGVAKNVDPYTPSLTDKVASALTKSDLQKVHSSLEKASDEVIDSLFKALCDPLGISHEDVLAKMDHDDYDDFLSKLFDDEEVEKDVDEIAPAVKDPETSVREKRNNLRRILGDAASTEVLNALEDVLNKVDDFSEEEKERVISIVIDELEKLYTTVENMNKNFSSGTLEETHNNNTFLNGEAEMTKMDDAALDTIRAAAATIASALAGAPETSAEAPESVEKDDAVEEEAVEAPEAPAEAEEATEEANGDETAEEAAAEEDLTEAVAEELSDEDDKLSEDELVAVLDHVAKEVDRLTDRIVELETLEKKLDQMSELAKALDITDQVDALEATVTNLTKRLDSFASTEALSEVQSRLDVVAKSAASSALSAHDEGASELSKAAAETGTPTSIWANSPISNN